MSAIRTRTTATQEIDSLLPAKRNPRTHSRKQVRQIADSIQRFGSTNPVLVDRNNQIVAGHGRVAAARLLGMKSVPTLLLDDLTPDEIKAYALADNKLALNAGWDQELLAIEFKELLDAAFDVELTGFSLAEVGFTLDSSAESQPDSGESAANAVPEQSATSVCRPENSGG